MVNLAVNGSAEIKQGKMNVFLFGIFVFIVKIYDRHKLDCVQFCSTELQIADVEEKKASWAGCQI